MGLLQVPFCVVFAAPAAGQRQRSSTIIEPTPPVRNLFARAEEAIARGDLKLAIDSLQRIVESPEGSLTERATGAMPGGRLYESARRRALARLADLPPEGRSAYLLLHNGKAKRLFEEGMENHDSARLRVVVDLYPLTDYGRSAVDRLSSWALDEGRPAEALALLRDPLLYPETNEAADPRLSAKMAVALAMLRQEQEARSVLDRLRENLAAKSPTDVPAWYTALEQWVGSRSGTEAGIASEDGFSEREMPQTVPPSPHQGLERSQTTQQGAKEQDAARTKAGSYTTRIVEPLFDSRNPWVMRIPGALDGSWGLTWGYAVELQPSLPVGELIERDDRVFARMRFGCLCLSALDLSPLWRWPREGEDHDYEGSPDPREDVHYSEDSLRGSLALVGNLLFLVSDRATESRLGLTNPQPMPPRPTMREAGPLSAPNRLRALDVYTGEETWFVGLEDDPASAFSDIEFRSLPIAVNTELWATAVRQRELLLVVLNPADGALVRTIRLGPVDAGRSRPVPLPPAYAQGMVFVPSGDGFLYAVDVRDDSVRWAVQYGSKSPAEAEAWLPRAPLVRSGMVLVAPPERDEMMAFSALDGTFQWATRASHIGVYPIDADARHVWIGGPVLTCVSLVNGQNVWTAPLEGLASGRAVAHQGVIYQPLVVAKNDRGTARLDVFDQATGRPVARLEAPDSEPPLGNLLIASDSVYSLDTEQVRKFPDRRRAEVLIAGEASGSPQPGSVRERLAAAWLAILQGKPERARQALDELSARTSKEDPLAHKIAHARYAALLAMARQSVEPLSELELVRRARRVAASREDRVSAALAEAEALVRRDRSAEAYDVLLGLALSPDAEDRYEVEDGHWVSTVTELSIRLAALRPRILASELAEKHKQLEALVEESSRNLADAERSADARRFLLAVSELPGVGAAPQRALLALADWELDRPRFEQAEQLLYECSRREADPSRSVSALIRLHEMYRRPELGLRACAESALHRLEHMMRDRSALVGDAAVAELSVAHWLEQARRNLEATSSPEQRLMRASGPFHVIPERVWPLTHSEMAGNADFLFMGHIQPDAAEDRVLSFVPGTDTLLALTLTAPERLPADQARDLWQAELQLPGVTTDGLTSPSGAAGRRGPTRAVVDGQVAVVSAPDGLFAVGLATGKRLWAVPFEPSWVKDEGENDLLMTAHEGRLVAMPRRRHLRMIRVLDGATEWERRHVGARIERIAMDDRSVVAIEEGQQSAVLLNRRGGSRIGRVRFHQPDRKGRLIEILFSRGVLVGPDCKGGTEAVTAYDAAAGQPAWHVVLDKPITQLFEPMKGYVGIGQLGGSIVVVNLRSGETVLERMIPGAHTVTNGRMFDSQIIVEHVAPDRTKPRPVWTALDIVTGDILWQHDDLAPLSVWEPQLEVVRGRLMAILESEGNQEGGKGTLTLAVLDAKTGAQAGPATAIHSGREAFRILPRWTFGPRAFILPTTKWIRVFPIQPEEGVQPQES